MNPDTQPQFSLRGADSLSWPGGPAFWARWALRPESETGSVSCAARVTNTPNWEAGYMRTSDVEDDADPPADASVRSQRRPIALKHIKALAEISGTESELLLKEIDQPTVTAAGSNLLRLGDQLNAPRVVLSGWACLAVTLPDGRRQLLDFALPGDLIGFSVHTNAHAKADVVCLTQVETVTIPVLASCLKTPGRFPGLLQVLHRAQDQFESRLLNQIVRNGCQTAHEKLCLLLFELYARFANAGLADRLSIELPISQVVIANALGLSTVHINRTFQHLKRERIILSDGHRLTILNLPMLQELAGHLRLPEVPDDPGGAA
jgi:CRP-like cAMP-binding protein